MKKVFKTLVFGMLFFASLNLFSQSSALSKNNNSQKTTTNKVSLKWNYSGTLSKYPIKAYINYGEGTNSNGSGALQIPITGYYFYESQNTKIPFRGSCNGAGIIYFVAKTSYGDETFDGQFVESMLEDFTGSWKKNGKTLNFKLKSRK
jgi:hypothetical protein